MVRLTMLDHRVCPQCGAENLASEPVCFACGASAGKKRVPRARPPETPWIFYLGVLFLLALFAVGVFYVSRSLAGYRQQAEVPTATMLLVALAFALVGQYGFARARRQDRSLWELRRAPQLALKQVGPGDDVWLRGVIACDSPLAMPYLPEQQCVYYEVLERARDENRQGAWRTVFHEERVVDFMLQEGGDAVYIPSGDLVVDAPVCVDNTLNETTHVKVSALCIGWQVSVCGRLAGENPHRRVDRLSEEVPALVTCQYPADYLTEVSKSERLHRATGWILSIFAGVLLLATCVKG